MLQLQEIMYFGCKGLESPVQSLVQTKVHLPIDALTPKFFLAWIY